MQLLFAYPLDDLRAAPSMECLDSRVNEFFFSCARSRSQWACFTFICCVSRVPARIINRRDSNQRRKFSRSLCRLRRCVFPARRTGGRNSAHTSQQAAKFRILRFHPLLSQKPVLGQDRRQSRQEPATKREVLLCGLKMQLVIRCLK